MKKILLTDAPLTHGGRTQPLKVWAEELGVSIWVLHSRRARGWSEAQVLGIEPSPAKAASAAKKAAKKPPRPKQTFTVDGITLTFSGWAKKTGVPADRIRGRTALGWTPREVVGLEKTPSQKLADHVDQDQSGDDWKVEFDRLLREQGERANLRRNRMELS